MAIDPPVFFVTLATVSVLRESDGDPMESTI
jgi:hypothetical protein